MVNALIPPREPDRVIAFDSVFNFRDLGGYPTEDGRTLRWRRVFRADGLHRFGAADAERFAELGIATVIDLRSPAEVEGGRIPEGSGPARYHHLPIFDVSPDWDIGDPDAPGYLADRYLEMLTTGRASVAGALGILAKSSAYPVVFHCSAGKDRTGILAAILLWILGVPEDVIAADYAMSAAAMDRLIAWWREHATEVAPSSGPIPAAVVEARPETILRFLDVLRRTHVTADAFVADLGLPEDVAARVRAFTLEPAG